MEIWSDFWCQGLNSLPWENFALIAFIYYGHFRPGVTFPIVIISKGDLMGLFYVIMSVIFMQVSFKRSPQNVLNIFSPAVRCRSVSWKIGTSRFAGGGPVNGKSTLFYKYR